MWKKRIIALLILVVAAGAGYFIYTSEPQLAGAVPTNKYFNKPFRLGLDLSGGTQLTYKADVSKIPAADVANAMNSLREIIERRVNSFGVSEAVVRTQGASFTNGNEERLTVELPGITDVAQAVSLIGQTPTLEFKAERPEGPEKEALVKILTDAQAAYAAGQPITVMPTEDPYYISTGLNGRYLKRADVVFDQNTGRPTVSITWNDEGSKLFADMTKANIGKTIAIYLDGQVISAPVVNDAITGGQAIISGSFTTKEATDLARRLNSGALPVNIELVSTNNIGATLGSSATHAGAKAGAIGFILIALFMILWYRLPGIIAILNLAIYAIIMLVIFKLWPVTLTAAGIAGFVISLGIAIDANILVFERIKEEAVRGGGIRGAIKTGFDKAWDSIRDSNTSSIITAIILYMVGTTLIKSFAFTFFLGTIISLFVAYFVSKAFFRAIPLGKESKFVQFLFGSGFKNASVIKK